MWRVIGAVLLGLTILLPGSKASAQAYPSKPVSLLIAFPPGGPSDVLARIVGKKLEQTSRPAVRDRQSAGRRRQRGGRGGRQRGGRRPHAPDGQQQHPGHQRGALQEDQFRSGTGLRADQPGRLAGQHPGGQSERAGALDGGADRAREANPGKVNYASSGHGAAAHLAAELFKVEAKVEIVHVPYKGAAPALQDVIAGHVQMMFATAASVVPHIQSGKVRALAVTTIRRTAVFPDLATIDELGLKGFDATTWHGLVAPSTHAEGTCRDACTARSVAGARRCGRAQIARRSRCRYRGQHTRGVRRLYQGRNPEMDRHRGASGATVD